MECKHIEELLSPYIEDELNLKEKQIVEEHLKSCQKCTDLFLSIKETTMTLADFPEVEVSKNLLERLYKTPVKKRKFKISFDFLGQPSLQPILAAVSVFLILISCYIYNPNKNLINKSLNRQIHIGYSKIGRLVAKAESFSDFLGGYKENIIVSLKDINPFGETEE